MFDYSVGAVINDSHCILRKQIGAPERIDGRGAGEKGPEKYRRSQKRVGRRGWRSEVQQKQEGEDNVKEGRGRMKREGR